MHLEQWTCMNYGFLSDEKDKDVAFEECCLNLYSHVVDGMDLHEKVMVEVGSGRGGGLAHLSNMHSLKSCIGVDISRQNVSFSNRVHAHPRLRFVEGRADEIDLPDRSVDVIINVESSHVYPNFNSFVEECHRILKNGGQMGFADFRPAEHAPGLATVFREVGFDVIEEKDVSKNVVRALEADEQHRRKLIEENAPGWLSKPVMQFAGVPGSNVYNDLRVGKTKYVSIKLIKP